jgi:hypothetical protein
MTNPFTRFINQSDPGSAFARFIDGWDEVEALLIAVYRRGGVEPGESEHWDELKSALIPVYPAVRSLLAPAAGDRSETTPDPVLTVLKLETLEDMSGNRRILKLLPDVREAINRGLLEPPVS